MTKTKQLRGTYIGPLEFLKGKMALLRRSGEIHMLAQFDDLSLPHNYTHGWTPLFADQFNVDAEPPECDGRHYLPNPNPTCVCDEATPNWPCPSHSFDRQESPPDEALYEN